MEKQLTPEKQKDFLECSTQMEIKYLEGTIDGVNEHEYGVEIDIKVNNNGLGLNRISKTITYSSKEYDILKDTYGTTKNNMYSDLIGKNVYIKKETNKILPSDVPKLDNSKSVTKSKIKMNFSAMMLSMTLAFFTGIYTSITYASEVALSEIAYYVGGIAGSMLYPPVVYINPESVTIEFLFFISGIYTSVISLFIIGCLMYYYRDVVMNLSDKIKSKLIPEFRGY